MFTRKLEINRAHFYKDEKLKSMSEKEANFFKENYPNLPNSVLSQIIKVFAESEIHPDIIDFLKSELEWREKIRDVIMNLSIQKKTTWGLPPKLHFHSHFQVDNEYHLHQLGNYLLNIMFWHYGVGLNRVRWFTIIRPDSNADSADSLIKLKLDAKNLLEIKCIARGSILVDNERNSRNLTQVVKLIELLAEKENWIRSTSYNI